MGYFNGTKSAHGNVVWAGYVVVKAVQVEHIRFDPVLKSVWFFVTTV